MIYIILSVWAVAAVGGTVWALILWKRPKKNPCDSCPFRDAARHQRAAEEIYHSAPPGVFHSGHYANTQRIVQDMYDAQFMILPKDADYHAKLAEQEATDRLNSRINWILLRQSAGDGGKQEQTVTFTAR